MSRPPGNPERKFPVRNEHELHRMFMHAPRRNPMPAPEVGIFDEPKICVSVNAQWWSHVSGVIDVLADPDSWLGSEYDKSRATSEIVRLLGSGGGCVDAETIAEGIRLAVCCDSDTADDDTGDPGAGRPNPPNVDIEDEDYTDAMRVLGGSYGVQKGWVQFLEDIDSLTENPAFNNNEVNEILNAKYIIQSNAQLDVAILNLDAASGLNPDFAEAFSEIPDQIAAQIYCKGFRTAVIDRAVALANAGDPWGLTYIAALQAISDEQVQIWYEAGKATPRTDFSLVTCVARPTQNFTLDMFDLSQNSPGFNQRQAFGDAWARRDEESVVYIELDGTFTDDAGDTFDALYKITNTTSGKPEWDPIGIRYDDSGIPGAVNWSPLSNLAVESHPGYSPSSSYKIALTMPANAGGKVKFYAKEFDSDKVLPCTGALTISIIDGGV